MPAQPAGATPPSDDLQRLITAAREDPARRVCVAVERIEALEAGAVVRPAAGVSTPRPGMRREQVPAEGAWIRLRTGGGVCEYPGGGRRSPLSCERPPDALRGGAAAAGCGRSRRSRPRSPASTSDVLIWLERPLGPDRVVAAHA